MTDTRSLPLRILLAVAAGLWAVLVPGQAAELMERPLEWPQWLRRPAPTGLRQPDVVAVPLHAES